MHLISSAGCVFQVLGDIEIAMSMEKAVDQKYAATVSLFAFMS